MKKVVSLLTALLLTATLYACGNSDQGSTDNDAPKESTTQEQSDNTSANDNTASGDTTLANDSASTDDSAPANGGTSANNTAPAAQANGEYYEFEGVSIVLPEGYEVDDNLSMPMATAPDYPNNPASLNFVKAGKDSISNYSKGVLDDAYEQMFKEFGGIKEFRTQKVDGYDMLLTSFDVSMNGVDMTETQAMIFLDNSTVIITFGYVDNATKALFDQSIQTIHVK